WKPDAYGEAPGLVGALLAGGLTTCAFLALLRFYQITAAAGEAAFARDLMVTIGLLSMAVAGVFMARQRDYKRMLAYSSVEHMGILVFGVGIGGLGTFGALLHLINNGLAKGVLFLAAGNIHRAYGSKLTDPVSRASPRLALAALRELVVTAPARGRRVAALFGHRAGPRLDLVAVLAADSEGLLELAAAELAGDSFPSMTPDCPEVHLFEREIAEQHGV